MSDEENNAGCWALIILMVMLFMSFGLGVLMTVVAYKAW